MGLPRVRRTSTKGETHFEADLKSQRKAQKSKPHLKKEHKSQIPTKKSAKKWEEIEGGFWGLLEIGGENMNWGSTTKNNGILIKEFDGCVAGGDEDEEAIV